MTNRFIPNNQIHNSRIHRPISMRVFVWFIVFCILGVLLSCGFLYSARQHFEAISVGYQSEDLRKQETQLNEKLRRLELDRARVTSAIEMEKRALKLGLVRPGVQGSNIRRPIN